MSRLVKKSPSVCTDLPLNSSDVCNKLRLMKELLKSSYGPTARLKQVHNDIGGAVVTTSTSSVLLQAISCSHPIISLIKGSILNHVSRFSDCGAQPVATLHTTIPRAAYGEVHNVSVRQFGSKTKMHLHPAGKTTTCTMILCHRNETMLNELKLVCQKTEHVLRLTLREPCALLGGGCTETHLAAYIRYQSKNDVSESSPVLSCSQTEYLLAAEAFCRSLESVATSLEHDNGASLIDLTHAHHWTLPSDVTEEHLKDATALCGCGAVQSCQNRKWSYLSTEYAEFSPAPLLTAAPLQPTVLDSFTAKVNALEVAVETANLVLDVRYVIQDVN